MVPLSRRHLPATSAIPAAPATLRDPDFRERMLKLGIVPAGSSQADVQAKLLNEMKRWAAVIVKGNIKPS